MIRFRDNLLGSLYSERRGGGGLGAPIPMQQRPQDGPPGDSGRQLLLSLVITRLLLEHIYRGIDFEMPRCELDVGIRPSRAF